MTKGRQNNPSTEQTGNWYKHKNCTDYLTVGGRLDVTSTGTMLNTVKQTTPTGAPLNFQQRAQPLYDQQNPFSYHDNRNNIQLKGEYLGNGSDTRLLGRRLAAESNQHRSKISSFLKHHSRDPTDSFFQTNYMLSHVHKTTEPPQHRRYAKEYREGKTGLIEPQTTTTKQFSLESQTEPYKTSNQTLLSSIEPYQKHNSWKYTYHSHGKHDVYPKVWGDKCSTHLPQFKPRNRLVVVNRMPRDCNT